MASNSAPMKKHLIVTTLEDDAPENALVLSELKQHAEIAFTKSMKINHCIGCNDCWIKTPGICCIKDDYERLLIKMLQTDSVIFLSEIKFGFVSSRMKNIIDRILPIATMHLKFKDGQMRHYSRYDKTPDMSLIYLGNADNSYLNHWLGRVQLNLHGKSLGAFNFDDRKELYHALVNN